MGNRGRLPGAQAGLEELRKSLAQVGEANIPPGALTFGQKADCCPVGRFNANWVRVDLSKVSGTGGRVEIHHRLGRVPAFVSLVEVEIPEGATPVPHIVATPVLRNNWTENTAYVDVENVTAGGFTNVVAWFWAGGE